MHRPAKRRAAGVSTASHKQSIGNFTHVSKRLASAEGVKAPKQPALPVAVTVSIAARKRKASLINEDAENHAPETTEDTTTTTTTFKRQRVSGTAPAATIPEVSSPQKEKAPQKTINTQLKWRPTTKSSSKSAASSSHRRVADKVISKAKQQEHKALSKRARDHKTTNKEAAAIKAKRKAHPAAPQLSPALLELLDMHTAFIKTLIIHIVHSNAAAPIDVRNLAPDVSRSWGKRNLTVEDLRRCLAIQGLGDGEAPFILADYGRGKICVEMSPAFHGRIDEQELCKEFKLNLTALCSQRASEEVDVGACMESLSLSDLPQAPITSMKISAAANPLLAKGHRALTELKSDLAARQQASAAAREKMPAESAPKLSLLDRLHLKQLAKAQETPLSGPEFERRVALQRVEDISAVISTLSLQTPLSLPRQAYAMSNLVQRVRDSLRLPISTEEAARCIKILANEVAPGWIRIMTIGGRENVVVQRRGQPIDRVIRENVQGLLA